MKKVLLTSTALVAFAGAAAAEVTLSGWAEMGVIGSSNFATQFWQDVDIDFTLSGETDNGLTFGANVDLDSAGALGNTTDVMGDVTVFVGSEFGNLTLGDTDGALDWALTDAASWGNPGSIADDETSHFGRQDTYLDGKGRYYDGQILRYDYTYEDFGFAVSVMQDDESDYQIDQEDRDRAAYNWAVGGRYSGEVGPGVLSAGIGYQQADFGQVSFQITEELGLTVLQDLDIDIIDIDDTGGLLTQNANGTFNLNVPTGEGANVWGLSAGYEWDNGFSFGGSYSDWDSDDLKSGSFWGIGAGYAFDAFSISANYGEHSFEYNGGAELDTTGWGAAAGYDLGGGLSILAGYGYSTYDISIDDASADGNFDTWSFGLAMEF